MTTTTSGVRHHARHQLSEMSRETTVVGDLCGDTEARLSRCGQRDDRAVGVYLDRPDVDWDEVEELLVDAYRLVAPATLRRQLPD